MLSPEQWVYIGCDDDGNKIYELYVCGVAEGEYRGSNDNDMSVFHIASMKGDKNETRR